MAFSPDNLPHVVDITALAALAAGVARARALVMLWDDPTHAYIT
jgi:hypothetical protein